MLKRLGAAIAAALASAAFATAPAYANHGAVASNVSLFRGDTQASGWGSSAVSCSSTTCNTSVFMSRKGYAAFVRWCGSASVPVTVPAGQYEASYDCLGGGPWYLNLDVILWSDTSRTTTATDSSPVTVYVNAFRSP